MSELLLRRRALMAGKLPGFDLLSQSGLNMQESHQENNKFSLIGSPTRLECAQGGNSTCSLSIPVLPKYKKLLIDLECSGRTRAYNLSSMAMTTKYGVNGYYDSHFNGELLKRTDFAGYNKTIQDINSQPGVKIHSNSQYKLERQTVEIDISDVQQEAYLFFHCCDNATTIYSIIAEM